MILKKTRLRIKMISEQEIFLTSIGLS